MSARFTIDDRAVLRRLVALGDKAPVVIGQELFDIADSRIMEPAKQITPVDDGHMKASGHTQEAVHSPAIGRRGGDVSVLMGFGGVAEQYVRRQHEDTRLNHTVGESKFLEKPLKRFAPKFRGEMARRLRVRLLT
jgi:hypothetical protein